MKQQPVPSQYLQIALDLANRITRGELEEGSRLYGRSLMASEYQVSPETIRRSLRLLADQQVVEVKPQSGVVVLSAKNAQKYIKLFGENADAAALHHELKSLLHQYGEMNHRLSEIVCALVKEQETHSPPEPQFPTYELSVPRDSPMIGESLDHLHDQKNTKCTVAAIRRGEELILSPGPNTTLSEGDVLLLVGAPAEAASARDRICPNQSKAPL